ncbi:hypothetical protein [Xylanimonas ulmi]|uniref:Uncharacterized protein n=1 Tax=Xylanimonas ulmi TaxID=228973 RepID=A0A4Q7M754_9MICO|nr:hypothetical protein [Xylanibacterium ulmi]RZS62468.1 hypothetical protein EV386_2801 [Xylanibacterium ulmi]
MASASALRAEYLARHPEWLDEVHDTADDAVDTGSRYAAKYLAVGIVGHDDYLPVDRPRRAFKTSPQAKVATLFEQAAWLRGTAPVARGAVSAASAREARRVMGALAGRRPMRRLGPFAWLAARWTPAMEADEDFAAAYRALFLPFGGDALTQGQRAALVDTIRDLGVRLNGHGVATAQTTDIWLGCLATATARGRKALAHG